jgi:hypothetical protein
VVFDPHITPGDALSQVLTESVALRYPGRFDDEQYEAIRRALEPIAKQINALRSFRLTNADEPDPIFRAQRGEG